MANAAVIMAGMRAEKTKFIGYIFGSNIATSGGRLVMIRWCSHQPKPKPMMMPRPDKMIVSR